MAAAKIKPSLTSFSVSTDRTKSYDRRESVIEQDHRRSLPRHIGAPAAPQPLRPSLQHDHAQSMGMGCAWLSGYVYKGKTDLESCGGHSLVKS